MFCTTRVILWSGRRETNSSVGYPAIRGANADRNVIWLLRVWPSTSVKVNSNIHYRIFLCYHDGWALQIRICRSMRISIRAINGMARFECHVCRHRSRAVEWDPPGVLEAFALQRGCISHRTLELNFFSFPFRQTFLRLVCVRRIYPDGVAATFHQVFAKQIAMWQNKVWGSTRLEKRSHQTSLIFFCSRASAESLHASCWLRIAIVDATSNI